jgi:hypothetical protein
MERAHEFWAAVLGIIAGLLFGLAWSDHHHPAWALVGFIFCLAMSFIICVRNLIIIFTESDK